MVSQEIALLDTLSVFSGDFNATDFLDNFIKVSKFPVKLFFTLFRICGPSADTLFKSSWDRTHLFTDGDLLTGGRQSLGGSVDPLTFHGTVSGHRPD